MENNKQPDTSGMPEMWYPALGEWLTPFQYMYRKQLKEAQAQDAQEETWNSK